MKIHSTAQIDPSAQIGDDVEIGAFCAVGAQVRIGAGTRLRPHVVIEPFVTLGARCDVFPGAVLGGTPQDRKFKGETSYLVIGDGNVIREHVTIHRAAGEGMETRVGDDNLLMAYCHIGHNCIIGSHITMANMVGISGHCEVEDQVVFGGIVGVHQKTRIGRLAMVAGYSGLRQDVPPFMLADGRPAEVIDLNIIGLRRSGISETVRTDLKRAYKLLYRSQMNTTQALEAIETTIEVSPERDYLLDFIRHIRFGSKGRQHDVPRP